MLFDYPGILSMRHEAHGTPDGNDVVYFCFHLTLSPLQFIPDPVPLARNFTVTPNVSSSAPEETRRDNITTKVSIPASEQVLRYVAYKFRNRPGGIRRGRVSQSTQGVQWYEHGHDLGTPQV